MTEKSKAMDRKTFLDILRVLATGAVVLLHTINGVKDNTDMTLYPDAFRVFLGVLDLVTWCVPVFVVISGYLFLNPQRNFTFKQMITKYCRRIVLALFLFGIPYACIELVITEHSFQFGMLGKAILMVLQGKSWSHMWYLYLILFLYLITPVLRWGLQRIPIIIVYIVMAVFAVGSSLLLYINKVAESDLLPVLPDTCIYIFYYLYGFLIARGDVGGEKKVRLPERVNLTMITLLAIGMVCNRMLTQQQIQMAYDYPFTVILVVLLFFWVSNRKWQLTEKADKCISRLSELCFTVYLIHPVYLNIAYKFLHLTPLDYPLWISLPVFWLVITLLSIGTAQILRKIPLLRKYVL